MTIEMFLENRRAAFRDFFTARFGRRWTAHIVRKFGYGVMNYIRDGKFPARRQKSYLVSTLFKIEQYAQSLGFDPANWSASERNVVERRPEVAKTPDKCAPGDNGADQI